MSIRKTPVLIVGGGPIGLALAAELGFQGVTCELIEQGDGVVKTPKMNEVNTRSMEFCRRWGIADRVLDTPFPADWPKDVVFVTSLSGYELGRVVRPPRRIRASEHSPESTQTCSQHWFDPIQQRFARSFPSVTLRYHTKLESFEETPTSVVAHLVDTETGAREDVEARYLCGCDGAGSTVRRGLGVALEGKGMLGHAVNMFFRAPDLIARCGKEPGTFFLTVDPGGVWANLRIIEAMGKRLSLPPERVVITVDRHANTSAASVPLALAEAYADGRIKRGDLVLMEALGGGLTWGSALVRM